MKRTETITLGQALRDMFAEETELHERMLEQKALAALPNALGPVARYIRSMKIKDGVLYLSADSPAVRNALNIERATLIRKINTLVGAELIQELRC